MTPPTDTATPTRKRWRWVAVLVFVALLWGFVELSGLREQISLKAVREGFEQHRLLGFLAFIALFALANLAHVPGAFFLGAAVLALGPLWGALTTYAAAVMGCTLTFVVVRGLGADALRDLNHGFVGRVFARLDSHPLQSVVLLRLVFQSAPTLNYALALSGVRLRNYVAGTLLGLPLPIAVMTLLFDTLAGWLGWVG